LGELAIDAQVGLVAEGVGAVAVSSSLAELSARRLVTITSVISLLLSGSGVRGAEVDRVHRAVHGNDFARPGSVRSRRRSDERADSAGTA
jgi:hypothetical protein